MTEPLTLYKLIILYMLKNVNFPLTGSQISDFVLGKEYTNYFTLQQVFAELQDSELIEVEKIQHTSRYQITEAGRDTLRFFSDKVSTSIQKDIDAYLQENKLELRNEVAVTADYYKNTNKEYTVECRVQEGTINLIELSLSVPDEEQATVICDNWKKKCADLYAHIMTELM